MTKRKKRIIAIVIPALLFAISATLFYFTTVQYQKSFVKIDSSNILKAAFEKGNYSLYNVTNEKTPNTHFEIDITENKKLQVLKISISQSKKSWFIGTTSTIIMNHKKYQLLRDITISEKGFYNISLFNPEAIKANLVIQNQNSDNHFFKLILVFYGLSVLSIAGLLIVLIVFLVKALRNPKIKPV